MEYSISVELLNVILNNLAEQPYKKVVDIIKQIEQTVKPIDNK